jgi:peptidoglycan-associated lipoprotein
LRADRTTIDRGQNLTLTWEARNAASVRIEPGLGEVNVNGGNQQVTPPSSVTYTATATGPGGSASDVARITVNIPAPPPAVETRVTPPPAVTIDALFADAMRPILFDYDQSDIRSDQIAQLQTMSNFLRTQPSVRFTIEGHADERGSQEYNIGLGDRRANAVKQYLASQGVADTRMSLVSFGEERPECRDTSEACYARNRRAAFTRNQ